MTFPPAFLDEIRARAPLAGVIGRRVRLQKRGREHLGLCPFHNEKTPSFTVNEDKGFYHCFGCGAHGDVIGFVQQTENLSFPEAVERLAGEAGLEMPRRTSEDRDREARYRGLHEVMERAAEWFEGQLAAMAGERARDYLAGRGLEAGIVERFRLGFAPDRRTALRDALTARGIDEETLVEVGLVIRPEGGGDAFDRFRDRVMFPIWDRRGRVVAFGGRALGEARAKYLNSPETPLFHKGSVLYGLHLARPAARERGTVLVAEGYMDVIALAAAGFENAVAPLGTALTEEQIAELWRLAPEPVLCLDGDEAGWRAALRAAERCLPLLRPGHSLRFAPLPEGDDPDSLVRSKGAAAMHEVVESALPLHEVLWRKEVEGRSFETPERRAALRQRLRALAGTVGDPDLRGFYGDHFEERLRAAFPGPARQAAGRPPGRHGGGPGRYGDRASERYRMREVARGLDGRREETLVAAVINHPELLEGGTETFAALDLARPDLDRLRGEILDIAARAPGLDSEALKAQLAERGFSDIVGRLSDSRSAKLERFVRPEAAPEEAERGWRQALARHRRAVIEAELEAAAAEFGRDPSPGNSDRLIGLRLSLERLGGDEAEFEPADGAAV